MATAQFKCPNVRISTGNRNMKENIKRNLSQSWSPITFENLQIVHNCKKFKGMFQPQKNYAPVVVT